LQKMVCVLIVYVYKKVNNRQAEHLVKAEWRGKHLVVAGRGLITGPDVLILVMGPGPAYRNPQEYAECIAAHKHKKET